MRRSAVGSMPQPAQRGVQHQVVERDQQHDEQRVERLHLRRLEPARLRHPVRLQDPGRGLLIEERPERRHQGEQHQDAEHAARARPPPRRGGPRAPGRAATRRPRPRSRSPPPGPGTTTGRRRAAASRRSAAFGPDRRTPGPRTPAPRVRRRARAPGPAGPNRPARARRSALRTTRRNESGCGGAGGTST